MLKRLLFPLLFATLSTASVNKDLQGDLVGVTKLWLNRNDTVGNFFPNKTTIAEKDLNQLTEALGKLDAPPKLKREAGNNVMYIDDVVDDEVADDDENQQHLEDEDANFEVESSIKNIQVPMKGGSSPAFSIHADKVYILYPSLFQDPNIFGRFSIPQNINLDPLNEKKNAKDSEATKNIQTPSQPITNNQPLPLPQNDGYNYLPGYKQPTGRKMRRQAPETSEKPKPMTAKEEEKKRNVESHLTGTIVVLNQDVNEYNRKESY